MKDHSLSLSFIPISLRNADHQSKQINLQKQTINPYGYGDEVTFVSESNCLSLPQGHSGIFVCGYIMSDVGEEMTCQIQEPRFILLSHRLTN